MSWLDTPLYGAPVSAWAIALAVAVCALFAMVLLTRVATRRLRKLAEHSDTSVDDALVDMLASTRAALMAVTALWLGAQTLSVPGWLTTVIDRAGALAVFLQIALWGHFLVGRYVQRYRERHLDHDAAAVTTIGAVGFIGRLLVWSVLLLVALDNFGFDVTALVAGLGIGGVAVALALQNVLGDLFAALSIVIDKPFVVDDFLVVGDLSGTVERVGLKTTRLRSLSGEQLVFGNGDLLSSRIRNYKRMDERRVAFRIGVVYETPIDVLERVPRLLRDAVEAQDGVRFDRAHFAAHADFAIEFETVYYVLSREYEDYMDAHQAVCFAIHRAFDDEGIEFAYPTRRLLVERVGGDAAANAGDGARSAAAG